MSADLHARFKASVAIERARAAKSDALFEFAFAIKQAGNTMAEMGARVSERCNAREEPRDWHLKQIRDAAAMAERAINAYETALRVNAEWEAKHVAAVEPEEAA